MRHGPLGRCRKLFIVTGIVLVVGMFIALRFGEDEYGWSGSTVNIIAAFGGILVVFLVLALLSPAAHDMGRKVGRSTRRDYDALQSKNTKPRLPELSNHPPPLPPPPPPPPWPGSSRQWDYIAAGGNYHKARLPELSNPPAGLPPPPPLPPPPLPGGSGQRGYTAPEESEKADPTKFVVKHGSDREADRILDSEAVTLDEPPSSLDPSPLSVITTETEFTAFSPRRIPKNRWSTLLAYMHVAEAKSIVRRDSWRRFDRDEGEIGDTSAEKTALIPRGAHIIVVPQSESMEFNPPQFSFDWLEDFQCAPFRFRPLQKPEIGLGGAPLPVRIGFYLSPVLVGEIEFAVSLAESASTEVSPASTSATPYQKIFVSYSHDDSEIADSLERAYKALGNEYLRDINTLRSGEEWNPAILKRIDESEIFQLLWSEAARRSQYVQQEWEHALSLQRRQFIRPVYWKKPMPPVPTELSAIHFAYGDL